MTLATRLPDRRCEGEGCGNRIEPGVPRRRNNDGKLLCPACSQGKPSGFFAEAMADDDQQFVLQDNITGRFLPERYTWEEAQAAAKDNSFVTVRRLDEAREESRGRGPFEAMTAGLRDGDERAHGEYTMRYMTDDQGERKPRHIIRAYHPSSDKHVGELNWYGTTGTVHNVDVDEEHSRKGLATAMWEYAQDAPKKPKHSADRTERGDAWARSVGGPLPRRTRGSAMQTQAGHRWDDNQDDPDLAERRRIFRDVNRRAHEGEPERQFNLGDEVVIDPDDLNMRGRVEHYKSYDHELGDYRVVVRDEKGGRKHWNEKSLRRHEGRRTRGSLHNQAARPETEEERDKVCFLCGQTINDPRNDVCPMRDNQGPHVPWSSTADPKHLATLRHVAHDSGDGFTIFHCPFCGSGSVVARGDGSTECAYCLQVFTVQVQPYLPGLPQTDPNVPTMGGQYSAPGEEPITPAEDAENQVAANDAEEEEQESGNPYQSSRRFVTSTRTALERDAYLFRLALEHADDRNAVIAANQGGESHQAKVVGQGIKPKGAKATCDVCHKPVTQMKAPAGGAWRHDKTAQSVRHEHGEIEHTHKGTRPYVVHHSNGQDYAFHYRADADLLADGNIDHDEAVQRDAKITPRQAADRQWDLFGGEWQGLPRYTVHFSATRDEWNTGLVKVMEEYAKRGRTVLDGPTSGQTCTAQGHQGQPCNEVIVEGRDNANMLHGLASAIIPGAVSYEQMP